MVLLVLVVIVEKEGDSAGLVVSSDTCHHSVPVLPFFILFRTH